MTCVCGDVATLNSDTIRYVRFLGSIIGEHDRRLSATRGTHCAMWGYNTFMSVTSERKLHSLTSIRPAVYGTESECDRGGEMVTKSFL